MPHSPTSDALTYLRNVDFDWVLHTKSIWADSSYDVESLELKCRDLINRKVEELCQARTDNSPIGVAITGQAGAGKTHLLCSVRRSAVSRALGFILVDMTGVKDFWETVLQGYISSLQVDLGNGETQLSRLIRFLIDLTAKLTPHVSPLTSYDKPSKGDLDRVITALSRQNMPETLKYQDTIRALFLLNSTDISLAGTGYHWFQGLPIDEGLKSAYGFTKSSGGDPGEMVVSLSWVMGLSAPTVLAFDQLDSIVTEHHLLSGSGLSESMRDKQKASQAIIEGLAGGLTALHTLLFRTLSLVSCLESTWDILTEQSLGTFKDRFSPILLTGINDGRMAESVIFSRLRNAKIKSSFTPPYPTWPFREGFFKTAAPLYPRLLLQKCDAHRQKCLVENAITELDNFTGEPLPPLPVISTILDTEFERLCSSPVVHIDESSEDELLPDLLQVALECLIRENLLPPSVDSQVEASFPGGKNFPVLHARLRLTYREEGDREQHLCLRALQKVNAIAFQSRLKAALTAAGIDWNLPHRRLIIVRTEPLPTGAKTQQLIDQFNAAGGQFLVPTENDIQTLQALKHLMSGPKPEFESWLLARRPVSSLPLFSDAVSWLFGKPTKNPMAGSEIIEPSGQTYGNGGQSDLSAVDNETSPVIEPVGSGDDRLPIGLRLIGQQAQQGVTISTSNLTKHTVILAGSGSGKTVLVKRIVEEALLQGIPSIVIDGANDLARLGESWPEYPESWLEEDRRKAVIYNQRAEVVIWTPGRPSGNPLNLEPIPDLAAVANDPEELEQATEMALDSLIGYVASGNSSAANLKKAVLKASLTYLARHGGGKIPELIQLLADLPPEAGGGITNAGTKAKEMADALRAAILCDPLLQQTGTVLDPASLFGLNSSDPRTRVSVINLVGLPSIVASQQFLNKLFMTLFAWIKKNPAQPDKPIRGLLVIDEAKDFAPAIGNSPCKSSLNRLVAQARKYGLGIIFATQAPKSIDHNLIANCSTHLYGRANSPAAIDVIREQLRSRGVDGQDISRLECGQFYAFSLGFSSPVKILAPMCLSYHPLTPLSEEEILARAFQSRL